MKSEFRRLHKKRERTGAEATALRFIFKYYPFLLGPYRIVNNRHVRWIFKNEGEHLVTLPCGQSIWVDLQDNDGRAIFCGGNDPKLRKIIQAVLREGDMVVDVGANHGEYTLLAAASVGRSGRVYAFEPNEVLGNRLRRSIEANRLSNVTVFASALADARGQGKLRCFPGWSGGTQVTVSRDHDKAAEVEVTTLDDFGGFWKQPGVRLLKIDVEGMEDAVLRGATRLLAEVPPDVIVFESNLSERPFFNREAPRLLAETGSYSIFEVCRNLVKLRLRRLSAEGDQPPRGRDFVAINRARLEALAKVLPLTKR